MPVAATGLQMHLILKTSCKKRVYSQYVVLSADEMKIEEAIVYLLATSQHGMKTEQIARELELRGLVQRRTGRLLM